jgi:hypothetical protein
MQTICLQFYKYIVSKWKNNPQVNNMHDVYKLQTM